MASWKTKLAAHLLNFVAGAGHGYLQGRDRRERREAEAERDRAAEERRRIADERADRRLEIAEEHLALRKKPPQARSATPADPFSRASTDTRRALGSEFSRLRQSDDPMAELERLMQGVSGSGKERDEILQQLESMSTGQRFSPQYDALQKRLEALDSRGKSDREKRAAIQELMSFLPAAGPANAGPAQLAAPAAGVTPGMPGQVPQQVPPGGLAPPGSPTTMAPPPRQPFTPSGPQGPLAMPPAVQGAQYGLQYPQGQGATPRDKLEMSTLTGAYADLMTSMDPMARDQALVQMATKFGLQIPARILAQLYAMPGAGLPEHDQMTEAGLR